MLTHTVSTSCQRLYCTYPTVVRRVMIESTQSIHTEVTVTLLEVIDLKVRVIIRPIVDLLLLCTIKIGFFPKIATINSKRFFLSLIWLLQVTKIPISLQNLLKGVWHEIFGFRFFSWISVPQAPKYSIGAILNFFENSRRYSRINVYHRCQRHR